MKNFTSDTRLSPEELAKFASLIKIDKATGCHVWQGIKNARGHAVWGLKLGGVATASRLILEHVQGPVPRGSVVFMSCGRRDCVRVEHARVGSYGEACRNSVAHGGAMRSKKHGSNNPASKLTESKVLEIRSLEGKKSMNQIAREFLVSHRTIQQILKREAWAHVAEVTS